MMTVTWIAVWEADSCCFVVSGVEYVDNRGDLIVVGADHVVRVARIVR